MGLSDVLLPFILIFTIVFAALNYSGVFAKRGDDGKPDKETSKKYDTVIALVFALVVVIAHMMNWYPNPNMDVVNIINTALPNVSVIAVAIVAILILGGVFGLRWEPGKFSMVVSLIWIFSVLLIVYIFGSAAGWGWKVPKVLGFLEDPDTQALLIIFAVFALIIAYITRNKKNDKKPFAERWSDFAKAFYGGESK